MDMATLLQTAAKVFIQSKGSGAAGSNLDVGNLVSAFSGLTGGQNLDVSALLGNLDAGGLSSIAQSWLGDGANEAISASQVSDVLGSDKVSAFASQLGLSPDEAAGGLSEALPQLMDQASRGGSLLDSFGGVQGALGLAGKLFGR